MSVLWDVKFTSKAKKQLINLPLVILDQLFALVLEIEQSGPVRKSWPNYSKLQGRKDCYHCHLKKGKPTYVVVWKVINKKIKFVEVRYVGTHEKPDYKRIC